MMKSYSTFTCKSCKDEFECPDSLIYRAQDGDYGIIIHDGGQSYISIEYCPWCGSELK